jgi:hypothetical protein
MPLLRCAACHFRLCLAFRSSPLSLLLIMSILPKTPVLFDPTKTANAANVEMCNVCCFLSPINLKKKNCVICCCSGSDTRCSKEQAGLHTQMGPVSTPFMRPQFVKCCLFVIIQASNVQQGWSHAGYLQPQKHLLFLKLCPKRASSW